MRKLKVFLLFVMVLFPLISYAEEQPTVSADGLFRMALKGEASFDGAIEIWAEEIRGRALPPASLYYNMANALALDGREGREEAALALYSQALILEPGNRDFRFNRNLLLEKRGLDIPGRSPAEGVLWFPLWCLGVRGFWALLLIAALASLLFVLVSICRRRIPSLTVILGALIFLLYGGAVMAAWEYRSAGTAVVRSGELRLYEGDSPLYPSSAVLKGGEALRILEERDGWYRIRSASDGREGWCEGFSVLRAEELVDSY